MPDLTHPCSDCGEASKGDGEAEKDSRSVGGDLDEDSEGVHFDGDHAASVSILKQLRVLGLLLFVSLVLGVIFIEIVLVELGP